MKAVLRTAKRPCGIARCVVLPSAIFHLLQRHRAAIGARIAAAAEHAGRGVAQDDLPAAEDGAFVAALHGHRVTHLGEGAQRPPPGCPPPGRPG